MNHKLLAMNYQPVIGLEVHVELKTRSKMFCGCSADYFGSKPNTHTCPVCLGLPGALPVPNKKAIEWCVAIGLALNCKVPLLSKFDRKNYFYPDLPKGYQISQYDQPLAVNGHIVIARNEAMRQSQNVKDRHSRFNRDRDDRKIIRIRRVHMEEDTGKLIHAEVEGKKVSLIDFNRSGVPLVEIVTEPDFENTYQVVQYLQKLQRIVRYLGVSNADMEKGDMRLEPNISLRPLSLRGDRHSRFNRDRDDRLELPKYKVEVKNINSFKFVKDAIEYEIARQEKLLEKGETPTQETRGWDEIRKKTISQRSKEEAHDYRYFPEPDIPPIRWTEKQVREFSATMPELPDQKFERFQQEYQLTPYDAEILSRERETAEYFEEAVRVGSEVEISPKQIANYIINKKIGVTTTLPAELIQQIKAFAKSVQVGEKELEEIARKVLSENPKAVEDYKAGKAQVLGFLAGNVRKHFPKSDFTQVRKVIEELLK